MTHPMSHFILYSKGWYQKNNLEEDILSLMQVDQKIRKFQV